MYLQLSLRALSSTTWTVWKTNNNKQLLRLKTYVDGKRPDCDGPVVWPTSARNDCDPKKEGRGSLVYSSPTTENINFTCHHHHLQY